MTRKITTIHLLPELKMWAVHAAHEERRSLSSFIEMAVEETLVRRGYQQPVDPDSTDTEV